jgi:hypothetical protein
VDHSTGAETRPATIVTPPPSQAEEPKPEDNANRNPPPVGGPPL